MNAQANPLAAGMSPDFDMEDYLRKRAGRMRPPAVAGQPGAADFGAPGFLQVEDASNGYGGPGQFNLPKLDVPQSAGPTGLGTAQPAATGRMRGPGPGTPPPAAPQTGGAPPPAPAAGTPAPTSARPAPGQDIPSRMAALQQRQAELSTPRGEDVPGEPVGSKGGQRPVLQSKGVGGVMQRVAMALLSATKLAPYAQQIVHPVWSQEMASNAAELKGISDQVGTLEKSATAQELAQRGKWYEAQAEENKGRYLRVGTGVFDQQAGQWVTMPTDKTGLVGISAARAKEVGLATPPDASGIVYVPKEVATQFIKPAKEAGGMYVSAAEGQKYGIQADENGDYYVPQQALPEYMKGHVGQPPTAAAMDAKAQGIMGKLKNIPPQAYSDMRILAPLIDASPDLTQDEKNYLHGHFLDKSSPATSGAAGQERIIALGTTRNPDTYVNTQTGQMQSMQPDEFRAAERLNPGLWVDASKAIPTAKAGAVYRSLHTSINQVRQSLPALGTLDAGTRAKLANALRETDPHSAISSFIQGELSSMALSDPQKQAIADLQTLAEDSLSLRMLTGMGQGSESQRNAILRTLPGVASADPKQMGMQLNNMERLVSTLEGGLPGLGRPGTAAPNAAAGAAPPPAGGPPASGQGLPRVSSQDEFNALPSGTHYINARTGKEQRKP